MSGTHPSLLLAFEIADQMGRLIDDLPRVPPRQTAKVLEDVLFADDGILKRTADLLATASHHTRELSRAGHLHPEIPLALALAANTVHDVQIDLDEHADELQRLAKPPVTTAQPAQAPAGPSKGRHR
ncbi:hypothetical protein [Streptomyces albus]|uniref:hypothetical protein n=1 Tax=Streptomyces albus TaxID=1888 RepID=UPI003F1D4CF6